MGKINQERRKADFFFTKILQEFINPPIMNKKDIYVTESKNGYF